MKVEIDLKWELQEWIKRAKFDELDPEEASNISWEIENRYENLKNDGLITVEEYNKMWEVTELD